MTADLDFDRIVASWLADERPRELTAEVVDRAFAATRRIPQRHGLRAWLAGVTPWPEPSGRIRTRTVRRGARLVAVAILVLVLLGVGLIVGSRLIRPAPVRLLGVIEPTGSMIEPRFLAVTTLLADGTVLVTGGTGTDQVVAAEVYDPRSGRFTKAAAMDVGPAPGTTLAQIVLRDGRVLVVGSTGGGRDGRWPYTPFARIYDPSTRAFATTGPLPAGALSTEMVAFLRDDGRVELSQASGHATLLYDPASGTISTVLDGSEDDGSISDLASARLGDGRIIRVFDRPVLEPAADILDEATGRTTELPKPPITAGGTRQVIVLDDGRVLIVGQANAIYDPALGTFEPLEGPVLRLLGRLPDGRILLDGENPSTFGDGPAGPWTFDPATSTLARLPVDWPSGCCVSWTALGDGRLLGLGGFQGEEPTSNAWLMR